MLRDISRFRARVRAGIFCCCRRTCAAPRLRQSLTALGFGYGLNEEKKKRRNEDGRAESCREPLFYSLSVGSLPQGPVRNREYGHLKSAYFRNESNHGFRSIAAKTKVLR